jgi:hypothetical protein
MEPGLVELDFLFLIRLPSAKWGGTNTRFRPANQRQLPGRKRKNMYENNDQTPLTFQSLILFFGH